LFISQFYVGGGRSVQRSPGKSAQRSRGSVGAARLGRLGEAIFGPRSGPAVQGVVERLSHARTIYAEL
jgi:hypothetical protein